MRYGLSTCITQICVIFNGLNNSACHVHFNPAERMIQMFLYPSVLSSLNYNLRFYLTTPSVAPFTQRRTVRRLVNKLETMWNELAVA